MLLCKTEIRRIKLSQIDYVLDLMTVLFLANQHTVLLDAFILEMCLTIVSIHEGVT